MDDYSALAQRISLNVEEVRGCLLLSRDGLVLGAFPDGDETVAKSAWLRFCALGEPERSFVEFTDQVWAFVHRGAYGAFAVADVGVRPGILVDQLEQVLMSADEGRARRETLRVPEAPTAPSGKPRSNLHPPVAKPPMVGQMSERSIGEMKREHVLERAEVPASAAEGDVSSPVVEALTAADVTAAVEASVATPVVEPIAPSPVFGASGPSSSFVPPTAPQGEPSHLGREPMKLVGGAGTPPEEEEVEVDRVLLAKEFSGLLQVEKGNDEASA